MCETNEQKDIIICGGHIPPGKKYKTPDTISIRRNDHNCLKS